MHVKNLKPPEEGPAVQPSALPSDPLGMGACMGVVVSGGLRSEHRQVRTEGAGQRPSFSTLTLLDAAADVQALQADGAPTLRGGVIAGEEGLRVTGRHQPTLSPTLRETHVQQVWRKRGLHGNHSQRMWRGRPAGACPVPLFRQNHLSL